MCEVVVSLNFVVPLKLCCSFKTLWYLYYVSVFPGSVIKAISLSRYLLNFEYDNGKGYLLYINRVSILDLVVICPSVLMVFTV